MSLKEEDERRLKRDRRVLDKQSRALLKLPNRKERSEVGCRADHSTAHTPTCESLSVSMSCLLGM